MSGLQGIKSQLILHGVNFGKILVIWGNPNENPLNGVISVKMSKLRVKTGIYSIILFPLTQIN
jgi:hypothetical protein